LIDDLPRRQRDRFLAHCDRVDLDFGTIVCEPDESYRHAYFPLTGFISLVATVNGHPPLELGLIGNEGMLGATLLLGVDTVPSRAVVQGAGTALRITPRQLRSQTRDSPRLMSAFHRYLYVSMEQSSQNLACTHFHDVPSRLARWLLMTHDRSPGDHFYLTHAFLADMLGVRRSGITVAAGMLQRQKLIRYVRGDITVLDRKGLEAASCECYTATTDAYTRQLP
jgi:CRP-like cAMP-binding protein